MSKKVKNLKWESVALEGFPVSMSDKFQSFVGLEECTSYGLDKDQNSRKKNKQKKRKNDTDIAEKMLPKKVKIQDSRMDSKKDSNKDSEKDFKKDSKKDSRKGSERASKKENKNKIPIPRLESQLINGFTVESCNQSKPSTTNDSINSKTVLGKNNVRNKRKRNKKNKNKKNATEKIDDNKEEKEKLQANIKIDKKKKPKLGENVSEVESNLTPEDMLTWAEFKLQEPIMKALTELGFKKPTKIQELSLPAAIHGRRDILGAAETGSGKTLAFGLPILSGILKLKEKAELKGLDIYELPYKKTSAKKKKEPEPTKKPKGKHGNKKIEAREKKKAEILAKESSEDGYGTDDEGSDNPSDNEPEDKPITKKNKSKPKSMNTKDDDDYLEEIEVPVRKRNETSADEGHDSDDSDNYMHLSDMLDSDDVADTSSAEEETENDKTVSDDDDDASEGSDNDEVADSIDSDDEVTASGEEDGAESEDNDDTLANESDENVEEDIDENEQGIGCVKVIDDVEMPGPTVVKTGKPLFALILTPTRELAIQISRHLIAVAKYTGIKIATIVGGMAAVKQERVLRSGPEVVVATPGRLWELITQGQPHLQQLESVKFLAIDETDRMVERGHFEELHPLLERLNGDETHRGARQNFVFSATLTMVHDLPSHMKGKKVTKRGKILNRKIEKMTPQQKIKRLVTMLGMTDPKVVDITTQNLGTAETLTESRIACALEHKDAYLYYILKRHPGRTIVFCNSIGSVKRLAQLFTMLKCRPLPLHASMPQRQRLKNLERFRDDPHGVLVATDVAARGLDIPDVDHVIHYQVPRTAENYVHRSGRTARATKEGLTILMMEPTEAYLYSKLCRTLNKTSEVPTFPVPPQQLAPLKELVKVARDLDALALKRRRAAQAQGWRDKVAREMDMIIDDDDLPMKQIDPSIDKALQAKKKQLESMLTRPLFPTGFSFKFPTLNDPAVFASTEENALQVMKKALESGELKKEKRKSKNSSLLKLQKGGRVQKQKIKVRKNKNKSK